MGVLGATAMIPGLAQASPAQPGEALCKAGVESPVHRTSDFARIYTLYPGNAMRVHKFVNVNGQTWAYGHGNGLPDGWTNAGNFRSCIA